MSTDNHEYLDVRSSHQEAIFRSIPRTVANRGRRNCTNDSEFVRAKSEYSNYLLRAGYNISSTDNAFQNVQLLSQETLVRKTDTGINFAITIPPRIPGDLHQKFAPTLGLLLVSFCPGGGICWNSSRGAGICL